MSTEFESLVRPFQTNNISPSQVYYTPGQLSQPNVILRIGRSGSGKVLTGNYTYDATRYCVAYETEKSPFASRVGQPRHLQFQGVFGQGIIGQPMGPSGPDPD